MGAHKRNPSESQCLGPAIEQAEVIAVAPYNSIVEGWAQPVRSSLASVLSDVCVVGLKTLVPIHLFKNELDLRKERFELCIEELPLISLELDQVLGSPEVRVIGVVDELVPAVLEIRKAVELIWEGPVGGIEDIPALQPLVHLAPDKAL